MPKDVLRFEVLLYLSLLVDALSAAFFGVGTTATGEADLASVSLLSAFLIGALAYLVWLAARRRKNWARWSLFVLFVLTLVLYADAFREMTFGIRAFVDIVSLMLSACGFYFAFTADARVWFKS